MATRKKTEEVTVCDICGNEIENPIYHDCLVCGRSVCDSHTGCGSFWRDFAGYYFGKHHRVCIKCYQQPQVKEITDECEKIAKDASQTERKRLQNIKPSWLKKKVKEVSGDSSQH